MLTKNVFVIFELLIFLQIAKGQIPSNDSAWVKQTTLSDEFNESYLDTVNLWTHANFWWPFADVGWPGDGASLNYTHNVIMTGTTLKLKLDTLSPNVLEKNYCGDSVYYAYQGERIWSKTASYKYGWLEISAKYPIGYYAPWVAFWLWNANDSGSVGNCSNPPPFFYNEIDIAENGGWDSRHKNTGTNIHVNTAIPPCGTWFSGADVTDDILSIINTPGDTTSFHKYSVQWDTTKTVYYIDNVPVRTLTDTLPHYGMFAILEIKADPWNIILPSNWSDTVGGCYHTYAYDTSGTGFPNYLQVDYMRYYKLIGDCNTALTLCTPNDYDRKVKKSITTNNSCTPTFNPSTWNSSYTLRATDYVTLDVGTTINPTGTGYFAIDILPCPQ